MGWFWDSKPSQSTGTTSGDAYRNLDPSLRDFLDKQTPSSPQDPQSKPNTSQQQPRSQPNDTESSYRAEFGLDVPGLSGENQNTLPKNDRPIVPAESLYQDGRYADLWKTYKSSAELAAESRSDQDKLAGVMETIRDRKAAIGRAALENCVEEQMAERDCYRTGTWTDRLFMCRTQNRAFSRCYSMQSRFLKALGYLSSQHATPADEERIQLHADKLYHEMLEREKIMDEAREAGREPPRFDALIPSEDTTKALGEESAWAKARRKAQEEGVSMSLAEFPKEKQKEVRDRLKDLTPAEKEIELQLLAAESRAMREYTTQIEEELREQQRERDARRERGKETVGDTLKRMGGYGTR